MAGKRQLLLELLAKDSTGPATKGAAENLADVATAAEEAAKAADSLGHQAEESKGEVERFGKSNRSAAEHADALKHEIEDVEHELHQLAIAFAEAETAADRADFSKAIRKAQSDQRKLSKSKGLIEDLVPSEAEIEQEFESLAPVVEKESTKLFAGVSDVAIPALAGIAVAAAPAIGATISGAIIGAVGLGGVVGGFALAEKDPRVKQAAAGMKNQIGNELKGAAAPFVDTSIRGISQVGGAIKKIDFSQIFQDSAKNAIPLIDGATTAVKELGGAIENVIHNSGPVVTEIGHELAAFSGTLASGLNSIADNGQQGAEALHQLFMVVNGTVASVFSLVNGLTEVYGALSKISGGGPTHLLDVWAISTANVAGKSRDMAQALVDSKGSIDQYGQAILTNGDAVASFTDQIEALATAGHSLFDSATEVGAAVDATTAAIKKNGKTLDATSEKGRANRTVLSQLATSLVATTKAAEDTGASQEDLNAVAGRGRDQFIKLARQFGLTAGQAGDLATQMGLIPAKKKTDFTANTHDAAARIEALQEQVRNLKGKTINVRAVVTASVSSKVQNTLDRFEPRAGGGPVKKGHAYVVGEERPELFVPDRDGTIIPSVDRLGGGAAAGGQTLVVEHRTVVDFANADSVMAQALIKLFRNNSGARTTLVKTLGLG